MKIYTNGLYCVAEYKLKGLLGENILNKITGYEEMDIETIDIDNINLEVLEKKILKKLTRKVGVMVINNEEMYITELNNIPVDIVLLKQLINNTFNKFNRYEKEKILKF